MDGCKYFCEETDLYGNKSANPFLMRLRRFADREIANPLSKSYTVNM